MTMYELIPICEIINRRIENEWPLKQKRLMMLGREVRERAKAIENAATEWEKVIADEKNINENG